MSLFISKISFLTCLPHPTSPQYSTINEKLYEPKVLSIGPFYHRKDPLQKMQQQKFRYLKLLLKRREESSVDKYVMAMRSLEENARKCYAEPIKLSPDEFVEMLILDGCFIIELIRKYKFDHLREAVDIIFQYEQVLRQVSHDLFLVENYVPFFVVDQLFSLTKSGNPDDDLFFLIQLLINDISPWPEASLIGGEELLKNVDHLLGLVYGIRCSSFAKMTKNRPDKTEEEKFLTKRKKTDEEKKLTINSITELQEAGIKFEKYTKSNFLDTGFIKGTNEIPGLDVRFIKRNMKIPGFAVSDETESIFRNLIAYEHFFIDNHPTYVTDYVFFLQCLINSSKDVEILHHRGILTNFLDDDETVYHMLSRLGKNFVISSEFCYADVYEKVNGHCGRRRNRWMAILRHKYFNSPWPFITFLAAFMLLLFTLIQTVFTVLSYFK